MASNMSSEEIKKKFINYFVGHGHTQIPAAPLIPVNDPSVLFTTAGMQQLKRYYTYPSDAPSSRLVTIQPCIRTSDIDEVGDDTHLTFFEMLGNFSFGYPSNEHSYFKKEAIALAWEFLTEVLDIDASRLHATYFKGGKGVPRDRESLEILRGVKGLKKIKSQKFEDNFWSLGTEGSPGGPTVEFYLDGLEVWNLVFNEYIIKDGKYISSEYKGVDTGLGLERLITVVDKQETVYAIGIFELLFGLIEKISGKRSSKYPREFRIIGDHIRAISHLLAQGVQPSNTGQGYIVRRLIRRSIRRAQVIGILDNPISTLAKKYIEISPDDFSSVVTNSVITNIELEEDRYQDSLDKIGLYENDLAMAIEHNVIKKIHGAPILAKKGIASGRYISENYQSYGAPYDLAIKVVHKLGLKYNKSEFNAAQARHTAISRASVGQFKGGLASGGEMETKYHTATHLLLAALRELLDLEIYQKGSNITAERLRFDFNYPRKLTDEQIHQVEALVNQKISENLPVTMTEMPKKQALKTVKISFDPSKYGNSVKVYTIGNFSSELCGGPHIGNTGIMGKFKIVKEESSSAGVRRLKAVIQ